MHDYYHALLRGVQQNMIELSLSHSTNIVWTRLSAPLIFMQGWQMTLVTTVLTHWLVPKSKSTKTLFHTKSESHKLNIDKVFGRWCLVSDMHCILWYSMLFDTCIRKQVVSTFNMIISWATSILKKNLFQHSNTYQKLIKKSIKL